MDVNSDATDRFISSGKCIQEEKYKALLHHLWLIIIAQKEIPFSPTCRSGTDKFRSPS